MATVDALSTVNHAADTVLANPPKGICTAPTSAEVDKEVTPTSTELCVRSQL
jgi:hypothetical protein